MSIDYQDMPIDYQDIQSPAPQAQQPPGPLAPFASMGKAMASPIVAAEGGVSNAGASLLKSGVNAALWASDKLGITNPDISNQAKQNFAQDINKVVGSDASGDQNDIFNKAASEHPYINKTAEYGTDAGLLVASSPKSILTIPTEASIGTKVGMVAANQVAKAAGNALVGAGVSGPNNQDQNYGALLNAGAGPIADLMSTALSKASKSFQLAGDIVKNYINPLNAKVAANDAMSIHEQALKAEANYVAPIVDTNNKNYAVIDALSGKIDPDSIRQKVMDLFKGSGSDFSMERVSVGTEHAGSSLAPNQINILRNVQLASGKADTMEKAVDLRQYISANMSKFMGAGVTKDVMHNYKGLLEDIDAQIGYIANKNKVGEALSKANEYNRYYMQPLHDSGAIDRFRAVKDENARQAFITQNAQEAQAAGKPVPPSPPINPAYTKAMQKVLPANMNVGQLKEITNRMDPAGAQILQDKLLNDSFGDVFANPENFNKNNALVKINQFEAKYGPALTQQTRQTINGMRAMLHQAGAIAKTTGPESSAYLDHMLGQAVGGGLAGGLLGGFGGNQAKHPYVGGIVGAGLGVALGPKIFGAVSNLAKQFLETNTGRAVLRHIAHNPQAVKSLLQAPATGAVSKLSDQ